MIFFHSGKLTYNEKRLGHVLVLRRFLMVTSIVSHEFSEV